MRPSDLALATALVTLLSATAFANHPTEKGTTMSRRAQGPFDVKVTQIEQQPHPDGITLGRYSLDKHYHGALEATAEGEMLTAGGPVEGSAGYVAVERVEGSLDGRHGSFALQHLGQMSAAGQNLTILVVPGSATGELVGLDGRLEIEIAEGGKHSYTFDYSLPERP
jgi:Protein of unknown function (DUF3224)